jgi:hypothetical protein
VQMCIMDPNTPHLSRRTSKEPLENFNEVGLYLGIRLEDLADAVCSGLAPVCGAEASSRSSRQWASCFARKERTCFLPVARGLLHRQHLDLHDLADPDAAQDSQRK